MKWKKRVLDLPAAEPLPGRGATLRSHATGAAVASATTDAQGWYSFDDSGHPGAFYAEVANGADRRQASSHAAGAVGPLSPLEIPYALSALGDGRLAAGPGAGEVRLVDYPGFGWYAVVYPGAWLVAGVPCVLRLYSFHVIPPPAANTVRSDLLVWRVGLYNAVAGEASVVRVAGAEGAAPVDPVLNTISSADTNNITGYHEFPIARIVSRGGTPEFEDLSPLVPVWATGGGPKVASDVAAASRLNVNNVVLLSGGASTTYDNLAEVLLAPGVDYLVAVTGTVFVKAEGATPSVAGAAGRNSNTTFYGGPLTHPRTDVSWAAGESGVLAIPVAFRQAVSGLGLNYFAGISITGVSGGTVRPWGYHLRVVAYPKGIAT